MSFEPDCPVFEEANKLRFNLLAFARRLGADAGDAEDAVSAAYLSLSARLASDPDLSISNLRSHMFAATGYQVVAQGRRPVGPAHVSPRNWPFVAEFQSRHVLPRWGQG